MGDGKRCWLADLMGGLGGWAASGLGWFKAFVI